MASNMSKCRGDPYQLSALLPLHHGGKERHKAPGPSENTLDNAASQPALPATRKPERKAAASQRGAVSRLGSPAAPSLASGSALGPASSADVRGERRRERGWAETSAARDSAGSATPPRAPAPPAPPGASFPGSRRAAPRLVPPPPAVRVRAGRCGFFSGLRGAPLLAPALAGTRFFRGLPGCQARAGCEDALWTASPSFDYGFLIRPNYFSEILIAILLAR
ncbi:translation initiation factor IF-2-like [Lynx rufus]|uniref:translation initiation factor IF-2-like n=1 Tax=Lynx rufus TaxID=61384 RepID=UPI001F125CB7|nr:translation initiation factor IF-2-like [Lynx rufus]